MLSSEQKFKVIYYLGYSAKTIIENSTSYNSQVADRLKNLSLEAETRVQAILKSLAEIDTRLECARGRLAAAEVQDIVMNPEEIAQLKKERRRLCRELGEFLEIRYRGPSGNVSICV